MAENKTYTLESAKELFAGDNWDEAVDKMSLEEMMSLDNAVYGQPISEGVADEALFVRQEAQKRIEALLAKDTLSPDELDSIAAFVQQFASNTIEGESIYANDAAKALMDKVQKQKDELAAGEKPTENEGEEFEIGETDAADEVKTEEMEDVAVSEGPEVETHEHQHPEAESETSVGTEEIESAEDQADEEVLTAENDELEFPEGEPAKDMSDKEFAEMLDPLAENMPEMTKEERKRQEERLEAVMALNESNPYTPEASIDKTLDFTVEQTAIRRLTVSNDEITKENLDAAREAENERISIEYYNAVFGACKTSEELDKETPAQHVERLGKIADLVSKKRPKEEIYAAMGINPTKEQETIASNAVYRTNAEPAMSWAKKLGKAGLKFMDKYREFEKNNPTVSLGLGLAMSGNPFYMGARMALSARGLYKDFEAYKAKHPGEKFSFIGMLKDKEARKSLAANAGIFIRSVPVVGQAYGMYGMAKQLKNTCKKGFWKDLGSKFKEAGKAIKEVAKNPKDKSKWKDALKKSQVPLAIVGGTAMALYGAYKGVEHFAPDRDNDGIPDYKDIDHGEGWATANDQQLDGLMNDAASVNAILGEGHNHTPEELKEMLSKGEFTDEQLKGIHALASKGFDENGVVIDKDKDGIADYKDRDHGEGWSANDKQLDSLMKDAEAVNAILGEGHNHTSEELKDMLSKGENAEGGLTTEQLKAIHQFAANSFDENGAAVDKDKDGIADYKDVDHGEGWATANETQLRRLMDADALGVNAILNDGKWHSSPTLQDMLRDGKFTEDQLKAIHALASREIAEDGGIIDKDLNNIYKEAKQADTKDDEVKNDVQDDKAATTSENEPQERTPAEQKMYKSILDVISKGEDMNDPAIKASVEALAEGYFNDVKGALAAGNEQAAVDLLHGLHKQGEAVEVQEATQREDDDSRGVRHAKEDLAKVSHKLDEAKAALAADPNNEKLQREVEKLEREFDKKSLNLDNKEIKQERSELKDRIDKDNTSVKNLDGAREQIEKITGFSQDDADKRLAAAGFDLNNLPKDVSNLSPEVQNLINAHNQYAQVDQTEAALTGRINDSEQRREDLKDQEKENKEAMKDVKKGRGFSTDDEKRAGIEDRLPGQSDFRDSELASSLVGMARGGSEPISNESQPALNNEEIVDKFLRDQVAKGSMSAAEAEAQREALIKAANDRQANMEYANQLGNPDNWQEHQASIDPSPLQGKPKDAPVYQPENKGETVILHAPDENVKGVDPNPTVYKPENEGATPDKDSEPATATTPEKENEEKTETPEAPKLSLKEQYLEDIEKNHGLENAKTISMYEDKIRIGGTTTTSLAMLNYADNGYAMTSPEGAESFVIDNENKTLNFRVGSGDNLRDMSYSEAKEFTESIINANNTENDDEYLLKYKLMLIKLYEIDKEAYAQDMARKGILQTYANNLECNVDDMKALHHENDDRGQVHTASTEEKTGQEPKAEDKTQTGSEAVVEPHVAETKAGNIEYHVNEQGKCEFTMLADVSKDAETYNALKEELLKTAPKNISETDRAVLVEAQVRAAYTADAINKDIDAHIARGENVPDVETIRKDCDEQLKAMGLQYDKDGHLRASLSNTGNVQGRGNER